MITNLLADITFFQYAEATFLTLKITLLGTLFAYIIGVPLGIILYGTADGSLFPNKAVNIILGVIVNIFRSIPFIILLVLTQPVAKLLIGTKIGNDAFIIYLTIAATPFVARVIESSFNETNSGVIEAAQSMGASNLSIIIKVIIPESKSSLLLGAAIALTTILGYTPMAYLIAGGGLGTMSVLYGLYRFNKPVMYISSVLLVVIVNIIQIIFSETSKLTDKRIRNRK